MINIKQSMLSLIGLTLDDNIGGEITLLLFTQLDLQINTAGESYA